MNDALTRNHPTGDEALEQLDDALAVERSISARIAAAAQRGDGATVERLSAQREIASAEVRRMLKRAGEMVRNV